MTLSLGCIGARTYVEVPDDRAIVVIPGLLALVTVPGLGGSNPDLAYNNAVPLLIGKYLPEGMLGLAITGLLCVRRRK